MEKITSRDNARIKYACKLAASAAFRRSEGRFFAEGRKLCPELAGARRWKRCFAPPPRPKSARNWRRCPASTSWWRTMWPTSSPACRPIRGVFGVFRTPMHTLDEVRAGGRYLALECVQDPGNVARCCAAPPPSALTE